MGNNFEDYLGNIVKNIPENPGVYQFFNIQGDIIYVGKARNLKRRVSSYFQKSHHENGKVRVMVKKICDIRFIIVETESDALLLENNLIKKYQPRYNILLKDDKTYPWICVKNEPFPRVFSTRNVIKDGSQYFGPYTSVVMVRTLLDLIKHLFQLRNCNLVLNTSNITAGKFKVCLEYHIGNCKGPCIGEQNEEEYRLTIVQIKDILRGNLHSVSNYLKILMQQFADDYKFEEAAIVKQKFDLLDKYQSKSTIVNPLIHNVDVFTLIEDDNLAIVNYLKVINGAVLQSHTLELVKRIEEDKEDLLSFAIIEIRERYQSLSREILVSFELELSLPNTTINVPKIGDKKKLLELSERNAKYYLLEKKKQISNKNPETKADLLMQKMKNDLRLSTLPLQIECFDNSNIQGTTPVASCVVFKNGKPARSEYRHFNIKTVEGPNDFASMEEIVYRRYHRLLEEGKPLPQLIVIDGGKGQLHAAVNSLDKLGITSSVSVIGIAKRLEEIYFPGDSVPIYIDKTSQTLKVIQHIRDEAHRFGITFHRTKRSKKMVDSELIKIPGIGEKTFELLYRNFGSISAIKDQSSDILIELIGEKKYGILNDYFNMNKLNDNQ